MPLGSLTDIAYLQSLLGQAGITPSRSSGQNFLISNEVIEATVEMAKAGPARITELGAGVGPLTQALVASNFQVRAIERDQALAGILQKQLHTYIGEQLTVVTDDLRTTDWTWNEPYQLVGNIPYNLSGLILRRLTQLTPAPAQVVLLVQQEVAERIYGAPPDMHLLGLAVQLWGHAQPLLTVPPSLFWPEPQVTSQLILIVPSANSADGHEIARREEIISFAKPLFQQRRKQIGSTLPKVLGLPKEQVHTFLAAANITPTQRPQELSVEQWQKLHTTVTSI